MATSAVRGETGRTTKPVVVMRAVRRTAVACGDCRHHVPQATGPGSWCGLRGARSYEEPVEARQMACRAFEAWPESSPVPAFLAAMRF
jgi:hypothetical protein